MAAGLGFKTFTTGEVLTAADTNGYLMQGINVFASTAARDAAITSPQEGQFAFTKDTNGLWYYDGAAWVASGATGDIEGVTAGVGISGGGTSGTVTVTNSMATAITTNGDLIYGTGSGTFTRRGIGSTGNVLTVSGGIPTWAAPAGGGKVLQVVSAVTQTNVSIATGTFTDSAITATITPTLNTSKVLVIVNPQFQITRNTGANRQMYAVMSLVRGSTSVYDDSSGKSFEVSLSTITSGTSTFQQRTSMSYLDSPATTSATTYKLQWSGDTNWTINCQNGSAMSSIILMEIGA